MSAKCRMFPWRIALASQRAASITARTSCETTRSLVGGAPSCGEKGQGRPAPRGWLVFGVTHEAARHGHGDEPASSFGGPAGSRGRRRKLADGRGRRVKHAQAWHHLALEG